MFAVLFSTTSFTTDVHYCCEKMVDIEVFGKATPCHQKIQNPEDPTRKCSIGDKDCCSNESFFKQGSDNLNTIAFDFDDQTFIFLHTFFYSYINLFKGLDKKVTPFLDYDPPLISKDLLVLHETFLI